MDKHEFYEGLMILKTSDVYEKKEVEMYDPSRELEEREFNLKQEDCFEEVLDSDLWDDAEEEIEEIEGFDRAIITRVEFTNVRISKKFEQLVFRYRDIIDRDILAGFCNDIISEYIFEKLKNDYIEIAEEKTLEVIHGKEKLGYHDSISIINYRLDKRINRKIDEWRGTYEKTIGGVTTYFSPPIAESLDTELDFSDEVGRPLTIEDIATDKSNIFYDDIAISNEELDKRLQKIYKQANLTDREIQVFQALERTPNNAKGDTYTRALAGELLNVTGQNISNIFTNIKKKIMKVYKKEDRSDKLIKLNDFLDSVEDEKTVVSFIFNDLNKNYMEYLLYYSELDSDLVRYFNLNNSNAEMHYTSTMRKFCTCFTKEVYLYVELIEDNLKVETVPLEATIKKVEKIKDIDTDIYKYIREDKLQEHERVGKCIIIDNERYYYVSSKKQKEPTETVGIYEQITYLKR